jgi:hypothetical protein
MEDLDSLLEDLGRGKSSSLAKKQRPVTSRVDLNELEDLMEDLAAPTSKSIPAPTPVVIPPSTSSGAGKDGAPTVKKDAWTNNAAHSNAPTNGTVATGITTKSAAPLSSSSSGNSLDDLDDLMASLNASSSARSNRRLQSRPSQVNAATSAHSTGPTIASSPTPSTNVATTPPTPHHTNPPPISQPPVQTPKPPTNNVSAPKPTGDPFIFLWHHS